MVTLVLLLGAAGVIYAASEAFTNGVEWLGRKLEISQTATGTVLAAVGTALPESVVTLVATAFGNGEAQTQIGIGAALGGPLALSTIAYAIVGLSVMVHSQRHGPEQQRLVQVNGDRLSRDQSWFLAIFAVKITLGLVIFAFKPWLGLAFLVAYGGYLHQEMTSAGDDHEGELAPLMLQRHRPEPGLLWVLGQTVGACAVIFLASRLFVDQLEAIGPWLGLSPQLTALLLSPVATELPETMNALIWVRQGKERLALANISGAMMIQATVPTAFGLFFTPWLFDRPLIIAAGTTALAVAFLYTSFKGGAVSGARLAQVGWLYGIFGLLVLTIG